MLSLELEIPICSMGSTTFQRRELKRGFEPDGCYYVAHESQMRGRKKLDLNRDPPPDLIVEVDVAHRSIAREPIFADFRVPELWRYGGDGLRFLHLRGGKYEQGERSIAFPFLAPADLEGFVKRWGTMGETALLRDFRCWIAGAFQREGGECHSWGA